MNINKFADTASGHYEVIKRQRGHPAKGLMPIDFNLTVLEIRDLTDLSLLLLDRFHFSTRFPSFIIEISGTSFRKDIIDNHYNVVNEYI